MKNVNWKELIITHAEKGVLGLAGLIVLIGLVTTSWGTYDKQPSEFDAAVTKGQKAFSASTWPKEREEEFQAEDPGLQVVRLFDGAQTYAYSTRWVLPLNKRKEKIKEPQLQRFESVYADAGKMVMEILPPPAPETVAASTTGTGSKVDLPTGVEPPRIEGPRIEGPRSTGAARGATNIAEIGEEPDGLDQAMLNMEMDGMPGKYGSGGGVVQKRGKAKGARFAAIRAVFPLKKQVEQLKTALNLDSPGEAYQELVFWDFELERQTAVAGADPWSGPWEKVDIKYALDLLAQTDFDVDVVDDRFREAVFSMPLPYRVTGSWARSSVNGRLLASHPRIKQVLTAEQQQEQDRRIAALVAADAKNQEQKKRTGGGFKSVQHDTKTLARSANQNSSVMNAFMEMMQESDPNAEADASEAMQQGLVNPYGSSGSFASQGAFGLARVTEISELLLFRFLDFSVVPGNAYRYKVRLVIQNPNFGREVSELDIPASREGEFRTTEWSDPSTPALVEDETDFYIAKVDERRGATIEVHEWMSETGSYVNGTFESVLPGDQISRWREEDKRRGGYKKGTGVSTAVLRPYEETYDDEVIDFVTPNTLVDLGRTTLLNPEDHPELEVTPKRVNLFLDEIVMINRFGELVQTDNISQETEYKNAAALIKSQEEVWAFLRERAKAPQQSGIDGLLAGAEDSAAMMGMGMGMDGEDGMMQKKGRRKSSAKRSPADMMQMMMQGF